MKKLSLTLTFIVYSFCTFGQSAGGSYKFSTMSQLKDLSYTDKVKQLQIPEANLKEMSTDMLVETCINYPLFHVITAFSNVQEGYNQVTADFNGFSELVKRPEAGRSLLNRYRATKLETLDTIKSSYNQGKLIAEIGYCELMLSQAKFMVRFDKGEIEELMAGSYEKYTRKSDYNISTFNKQFSVLVMAKALIKSDSNVAKEMQNDAEISSFLDSAVLKSHNASKNILESVEKHLKLIK